MASFWGNGPWLKKRTVLEYVLQDIKIVADRTEVRLKQLRSRLGLVRGGKALFIVIIFKALIKMINNFLQLNKRKLLKKSAQLQLNPEGQMPTRDKIHIISVHGWMKTVRCGGPTGGKKKLQNGMPDQKIGDQKIGGKGGGNQTFVGTCFIHLHMVMVVLVTILNSNYENNNILSPSAEFFSSAAGRPIASQNLCKISSLLENRFGFSLKADVNARHSPRVPSFEELCKLRMKYETRKPNVAIAADLTTPIVPGSTDPVSNFVRSPLVLYRTPETAPTRIPIPGHLMNAMGVCSQELPVEQPVPHHYIYYISNNFKLYNFLSNFWTLHGPLRNIAMNHPFETFLVNLPKQVYSRRARRGSSVCTAMVCDTFLTQKLFPKTFKGAIGSNMDDTPWDISNIREEEFDQLAVYLVPDQPSDENCESRTESSLPRNLVLRPSQTLTDKERRERTLLIFRESGTKGTNGERVNYASFNLCQPLTNLAANSLCPPCLSYEPRVQLKAPETSLLHVVKGPSNLSDHSPIMIEHLSFCKVMGVWSTSFIPKGTRFGPLVGQIYKKDEVPKDTNRKYFWRIYNIEQNALCFYIDGYDVKQANWMRNVNPAYSSGSQNLIACQVKMQIYFYTIKPVLPNEELLVWYSKEFAERLNFPPTGELMLEKIKQRMQSSIHENGDLYYPTTNPQQSPTDGSVTSVRSDEGYHSYHDDAVMTPTEEISDSESENNYVLDFSVKKSGTDSAEGSHSPKRSPPRKENDADNADDPCYSNEFRYVLILNLFLRCKIPKI
ncbi:PR domain zinc finger protein 1 [Nymphon striatum]|nr:PR domain zinc finger protein 1 [Nymphon striatum]